ncbi:MAG: transporter [Cytophagaceae bacterium]
MNKTRYIYCLCLSLFSLHTFAQDEMSECRCTETDRSAPAGVYIDHVHTKHEWMFSYRYMQTNLRGILQGHAKTDASQIYNDYVMAPQSMKMQMHMLMLMYGLSDKITFMGMSSYSLSSMNMSMMEYGSSAHVHPGTNSANPLSAVSNTSGFADTKIYTLYEALARDNHEIVLSGGLNIPTGSISLSGPSMTGVSRYTYMMQPGTGSFALLPGITYTWNPENFSGGMQLSSALRTGKNKNQYRWGNEANMTGWIARRWTDWLSTSARADFSVNGKIIGYDPAIASQRTIDPSADANNYGGKRSLVYGGINLMAPQGRFKGLKFSAEYGLPVYQNTNGTQLSLQSSFYTNIQYGF